MIVKDDILEVGTRIDVTDLTDLEINKILDEHEVYQNDDPGGTWDLVVEQQIQEIISYR